MKAFLVAVITTGCLSAGQVQIGASVPSAGAFEPASTQGVPNPPRRSVVASVPLLGYAAGPGPADIYALVGTAARPQWGEQVQTPDGTARVYLPPAQQYSLIEKSGEAPLAVWNFKQQTVPLVGAMSHPDSVTFSPRGDAAILLSKSDGLLQVIADLPAQPRLSHVLSIPNPGDLSSLVVSDDGLLVAAQFGDGTPIYSFRGEAWRMIGTTARPQAWSFVPRTYDLVMSDATRNEIVLLSAVNGPHGPERALATGVFADRLALTKQGDQLLAESSKDGSVLQVSLTTGRVSRLQSTGASTQLSVLRSGSTFLLSISPSVVLKALASPNEANVP